MTAHDVVVVGSANLDLIATLERIPTPGETVLALGHDARAGGKGLNQAVAAARAGARTAFVAAVGDDDAATVLLDEAAAAGIDIELVRRTSGRSGTAWIMVRADGENAIVVDSGANATLDALTDDERAVVVAARVLVCQLETPLPAVAQALSAARAAGVRTVLNAAPARALPDDLLADVDVLVVNEHEARQLGDAVALAGSVVTTLGADGAVVEDPSGRRAVPGVPADVVDTTGAGDTFTGVVAASLAAGSDLEAAVARAVVAGALAVERPGAVPAIPTAAEIDERIRR
jgi:ribokinase